MAGEQGTPHDEGVAEARERSQLRRQIEAEDVKTDAVAESVLQARLGDDYPQTLRALQQHIAGLPAEERSRLERATTKSGMPVLQDPDALLHLTRQALGDLPKSREGMEAELAEARKRMAKPGSGWFQDDRAQLRYRAIVENLGKAKP